jgi:hypothetical protein
MDSFTKNTAYPKINYSDKKIENCINIQPHTILFNTDISPQKISVTHKKEIPYFFKTAKNTDFDFDIFASSFYMLSRYEEYLPFSGDKHNRFTGQESLAYKANFLQKPVVHLWAKQLQEAILKQKTNFLFPTRIFTHLNTIDIDIAYAFKGKSFKRRFGGFFRSLISFDFLDIKNRILHLSGGRDPYDTYQILKEIQDDSNAKSHYFFQVGKHGTFDKNLPLNKYMLKLISKVSQYADIGIHPSYQSNLSLENLKDEINSLSKIIDKPISKSRQHYLKMTFPNTYENLISAGITADYTLGFADKIGFRAGIAIPYPFFNLVRDEIRPLTIHPFQIMDGSLKDYMKLSPKEAILKVDEIKKATKDVQGQFISIFHNSSVTNQGEMKGWLAIYKSLF